MISKNNITKAEELISKIPTKLKQELKNATDRQIMELLVTKGPLTRAQLVQLTKSARTTLYDSLMRLTIKKLVKSYSENSEGRPGRPKVYFQASVD